MKRLLGWMAGLVVLIVAILCGLALLQPDRFRVERSIEIAAPPDPIFGLIHDFTQWVKWSPWEKLDPDMKRTYGNPFSGMGASYAWSGNDEVGEGRMRISTARMPNGIFIELFMTRPWPTENRVEFKFEPGPAGTRLTWAIQGPVPFPSRVLSLFRGHEQSIGPRLEQGLMNLKQVVEADARTRPAPAPAAVKGQGNEPGAAVR